VVVFEDGRPARELAGGTVTFTSEELKKTASGDIDADGNFRLSTEKKNDGAFPGMYRVAVVPPEPELSERSRAPQKAPPIDRAYENPKTSGLEFPVEAKSNEITITLRRPRPAR
jgi:hypothetical protein